MLPISYVLDFLSLLYYLLWSTFFQNAYNRPVSTFVLRIDKLYVEFTLFVYFLTVDCFPPPPITELNSSSFVSTANLEEEKVRWKILFDFWFRAYLKKASLLISPFSSTILSTAAGFRSTWKSTLNHFHQSHQHSAELVLEGNSKLSFHSLGRPTNPIRPILGTQLGIKGLPNTCCCCCCCHVFVRFAQPTDFTGGGIADSGSPSY